MKMKLRRLPYHHARVLFAPVTIYTITAFARVTGMLPQRSGIEPWISNSVHVLDVVALTVWVGIILYLLGAFSINAYISGLTNELGLSPRHSDDR